MSRPLRTCRVCRTQRPKDELVRWVITGGWLVRDERQNMAGRGYYTCKEQDCVNRLEKVLKKQVRANG